MLNLGGHSFHRAGHFLNTSHGRELGHLRDEITIIHWSHWILILQLSCHQGQKIFLPQFITGLVYNIASALDAQLVEDLFLRLRAWVIADFHHLHSSLFAHIDRTHHQGAHSR